MNRTQEIRNNLDDFKSLRVDIFRRIYGRSPFIAPIRNSLTEFCRHVIFIKYFDKRSI